MNEWQPSFSLHDTNLRLSQLRGIIIILYIIWFIIGLIDLIITNIYCPPLIFLYLCFPSTKFPLILSPFILYLFIIIICFCLYGWKFYCYFNISHILYGLLFILISIIICILFILSPIFIHILILYKCCNLARKQMFFDPYSNKSFGYMRDVNHYFYSNVINKLHNKNTNKLSNSTFLRCLLYTIIHFHAIRKYKNEYKNEYINCDNNIDDIKHSYLEIITDIMHLLRRKNISITRFNGKINNIYWKKYCMSNFNFWWNNMHKLAHSQTMSNYGKLFIVSLFIHTVLYWSCFGDQYLRENHTEYVSSQIKASVA